MENLNREWNTCYWNHIIKNWDEIVPPTTISDLYDFNGSEYAVMMPMVLDYNRFQSDSLLRNYQNEYQIIKSIQENQ
nr:Glyco_hydro_42 [uncultured bacterium]